MPYKIGKYAISGDTDDNNFNLIMDHTEFELLNNELFEIYQNKDKINLIGINYDNTKEIKQDSDIYTITMINNYDNYKKYNLTSNMVLAGHNLGGEIRLFNVPLLGLDKHLNTYYQEGNTKIYISSGLGTIHHMRFMNKPSINVYRLYNE
jgi:predicted MPP superfamily phosphohydrolase